MNALQLLSQFVNSLQADYSIGVTRAQSDPFKCCLVMAYTYYNYTFSRGMQMSRSWWKKHIGYICYGSGSFLGLSVCFHEVARTDGGINGGLL